MTTSWKSLPTQAHPIPPSSLPKHPAGWLAAFDFETQSPTPSLPRSSDRARLESSTHHGRFHSDQLESHWLSLLPLVPLLVLVLVLLVLVLLLVLLL